MVDDRVHHQQDNVTDYCSEGTCGWNFEHEERLRDLEENVGRILAGSWPDRSRWGVIPPVQRNDPDFGDEAKGMEAKEEDWLDDDNRQMEGNEKRKVEEGNQRKMREITNYYLRLKARGTSKVKDKDQKECVTPHVGGKVTEV